jgi:ectoine hydroxylase-related dioxygenase (phytanoyl-CoA dioxygenase family)
MKLGAAQQQRYARDGYLVLPDVLDDGCLDEIERALPDLFVQADEGRVLERDGRTVRSIYCSHVETGPLAQLVRDSRLLVPAQQLVGEDVYLYQLKVNFKRAHSGDVWHWHQDFVYWKNEDGLPSPDLVNAVIFLDDVTADNGPIQLIARSHAGGSVPPHIDVQTDAQRDVVSGDRYTLSDAQMTQAKEEAGEQVSAVGTRGSVLYFHPNVIHGSSANASSQDRRLVLITYCSVNNRPTIRRAHHLVGRDYRPLRPLVAA